MPSPRLWLWALILLMTLPAQAQEPFVTAYTVCLMAGHHAWFQTPEPNVHIPELVRILQENYGANTLYVVYGGQTSPSLALEVFAQWFDAGEQVQVEIIPVLSLIHNYYALTRPQWIVPQTGSVPKVDLRNPEVIKAYQALVRDLEDRFHPRTVGIFEFNEFSAGLAMGTYPQVRTAEARTWVEAMMEATHAKAALTFMQPWGVGLRWLEGIERVSLDTYGFLRDSDWEGLLQYTQRAVERFPQVDGDLIILDDYGGEISAQNQKTAAQVMLQAGVTGFNMDLIIIAHVLWYRRG